jgi:hypothetical protein
VPGDGPVLGLGRSLADAGHVRDPCGTGSGAAPGAPARAAGAQGHPRLGPVGALGLDEQGLVDRLVTDVHCGVAEMGRFQAAAYLLG